MIHAILWLVYHLQQLSSQTKMVTSDEDQLICGDIVEGSERLFKAFSRTSRIGFAIVDGELRYRAVNACLARINGIPAKAHLGVTTREMFGELSQNIAEPSYRRVLDLGQTLHFEVKNAVLPTRADSRFWALNTNFPVKDRCGTVRQLGIMVVEVTEQRKLEQFLHAVAGKLRHTKTKQ